MAEELLITVPEAGRRLGISRTKAWELSQRNELPTVRIGRSVRVPVDQLREWIDAKATTKAGPR